MKPLIGLTSDIHSEDLCRCSLRAVYVDAVENAGGRAVILPPFSDVVEISDIVTRLDALVLTGGGDIDPAEFGEKPHPLLGRVEPRRDKYELALARKWLEGKKPLLGICRGVQTLNVAAGGSLIQDIASQHPGAIEHNLPDSRAACVHPVTISKGSLLSRVLQTSGELSVNSVHHQAVAHCADGFVVTATAPDGVIEAIESLRHPFVLGVQWHPEEIAVAHPVHARLFQHLVKASLHLDENVETMN